jgi:hypothetical protein
VLLALLVWGGLIALVVFAVRTVRSSGMSRQRKALYLMGAFVVLAFLWYIAALAAVR